MTQGYHAADDGSLARSTGGAAARGAMLIAVALIIGLLLMAFALDDPQTDLSTAASNTETDTGADAGGDDGDGTADADAAAGVDDDPSVDLVDPGDGTIEDGGTPAVIPEDDTTTETIPEDPAPGVTSPPSEINVLIANGTGAAGVAGSVADTLKAQAYIANVSNAPSTAEAIIYYRVGFDNDARAIASLLGSPPDIITPAPDDGTIAVSAEAVSDGRLAAAQVIVIIGADNNVPTG